MSDEAETVAAEPPTEVDVAEAATSIERPRVVTADDIRQTREAWASAIKVLTS